AVVLSGPNHKQLAYEMAVCVCDADGVANAAELTFLKELRTSGGLDAQRTLQVEKDAAALADAPLSGTPAAAAAAAQVVQASDSAVRQAALSDAELDRYIL